MNSQNKLIKHSIVTEIYQQLGISFKASSELVNDIIEEIISELVAGNNVKITNFGTFKLLDKKERMGRNPKTKEKHVIIARRVVSFSLCGKLRKALNSDNST